MRSSESASPNDARTVFVPTDMEREDIEAAKEIITRKVSRSWEITRTTRLLKEEYFRRTFGYESDEDDDDFFPENPVIPSRCTDSEFIHFYNTCSSEAQDDSEDLEDSEVSGKWMVFFDRQEENEITGLTALDDAWQKIIGMDNFESTGISSAVCSTALIGPPSRAPSDNNGVICCFIPDYTNKVQVKKAADSIRELVEYPRPMFFKTDADTLLGKYRHLGHKSITIYKHTPNNKLYARSKIDNMWYPVHFEEGSRQRNYDFSSVIKNLNNLRQLSNN